MRVDGFRLGWAAALWAASSAALLAHLPTITLTSNYVNIVVAPGGAAPVQTVQLGTNQHPYVWTAAVATTGGGEWLSVSPNRGAFSGNFEVTQLRISASSAGLPVGVYYGTITISAPATGTTPQADNTPQVIEVALSVTSSGQAAPGFAVTPASLALEGVRGTFRVESQTIQVRNAGGGSLNWSATATTDAGGNWLTLNPASGTNSSVLTATAAVASLATGSYSGRITFTAPGAANSTFVLPVTFLVRDPRPPELVLTPASVTFHATQGDPIPPSQPLVITNGGEGTLSWRVSAQTFSGGAWLTASPAAGTGRGVVILSAEAGGLGPGTYMGRITVAADGVQNSPVQVSVTLTVRRPQPFFARVGVVNAATFQPTPVAPGEIVSLFGSRLGPREGVAFT